MKNRAHALPRLAGRIFDVPLAITESRLDGIIGLLGERIGIEISPEASWDDDGDEAESGPGYTVTPDGIAVLPVAGPLVRTGSWMSTFCGMSSYDRIGAQFESAMADPTVSGILLDVDSPGGECSGCFDLVDQMFAAKGSKPVYAASNDSMYSAAYAIGSVADKIFVSRTSGVGSIGVIAKHVDRSGADAQTGLKYTSIYAGDHKDDGNPHAPLSDRARESIQAEVDRLYGMFVDTAARNRGMSADAIRDTQAATYHGPDAVSSGLADAVGTLTDAYSALVQATQPKAASQPLPILSSTKLAVASAAAISEGDSMSEQNTAVDKSATATQPVVDRNALIAEARKAAAAETSEILSLCGLAGKTTIEAQSYIERGMSVSQVLKELSAERTTASAQNNTTSAVVPGTSADANAGRPGHTASPNILLEVAEDMKRNADAMKAASRRF